MDRPDNLYRQGDTGTGHCTYTYGYYANGAMTTRTCQNNGQWSGSSTNCKKGNWVFPILYCWPSGSLVKDSCFSVIEFRELNYSEIPIKSIEICQGLLNQCDLD